MKKNNDPINPTIPQFRNGTMIEYNMRSFSLSLGDNLLQTRFRTLLHH